jgi:hypothetical protein
MKFGCAAFGGGPVDGKSVLSEMNALGCELHCVVCELDSWYEDA